jgi:hypothetical protein
MQSAAAKPGRTPLGQLTNTGTRDRMDGRESVSLLSRTFRLNKGPAAPELYESSADHSSDAGRRGRAAAAGAAGATVDVSCEQRAIALRDSCKMARLLTQDELAATLRALRRLQTKAPALGEAADDEPLVCGALAKLPRSRAVLAADSHDASFHNTLSVGATTLCRAWQQSDDSPIAPAAGATAMTVLVCQSAVDVTDFCLDGGEQRSFVLLPGTRFREDYALNGHRLLREHPTDQQQQQQPQQSAPPPPQSPPPAQHYPHHLQKDSTAQQCSSSVAGQDVEALARAIATAHNVPFSDLDVDTCLRLVSKILVWRPWQPSGWDLQFVCPSVTVRAAARALLLHAVHLDPLHACALTTLGTTLAADEKACTLLDGRTLTARELHVMAISLQPTCSMAYSNLAELLEAGDTATLSNGGWMDQAGLLITAVDLDPCNAPALISLACTMASRDQLTLRDDRVVTRLQLLLEAVDVAPGLACAYCQIAVLLLFGESAALRNGEELTEQQLYLRAIEADPAYAMAYVGLAEILSSRPVTLSDGRVMNRQKLYIEALAHDPHCFMALLGLAILLSSHKQRRSTVTLQSGRVVSCIELCVEAIELCPRSPLPFLVLSRVLPPARTVRLRNGKVFTEEDIAVEVYERYPHFLPAPLSHELRVGRLYDCKLQMRRFCSDLGLARVYCDFGELAHSDRSIVLRDGRKISVEQLLLDVLEEKPTSIMAHYNLASHVGENGSIVTKHGQTLTQKDLFDKSLLLSCLPHPLWPTPKRNDKVICVLKA